LSLEGDLVWKFRVGGPIGTVFPAIANNMIYFVSSDPDPSIYALTLDGEKKWSFRTGEMLVSSPTIYNNVVYFGSRDRLFYALNSKTGEHLWDFETNAGVFSKPIIYKNRIYFGSDRFYALNLSGDEHWEFEPDEQLGISFNLVIHNNKIFFGCFDAHVYALSLEGDLEWKFRTKGVILSASIIKDILPPPKWNPLRWEELEMEQMKKELESYKKQSEEKGMEYVGGSKKYTAGTSPYEKGGTKEYAFGAENLNEYEKRFREWERRTHRR